MYLQILQQIHLYALNPFFPKVHPDIHSILTSPNSLYASKYLLALYEDYGPSEIIVRATRHAVCNVAVICEIKRIWDKRRGYTPPKIPSDAASSSSNPKASSPGREPTTPRSRPSTPEPTAPPLSCSELPRRLFREPRPDAIDPLLVYLFDHYLPSPNSHHGYPLCRAVLTSNHALVEYLLHHGADPGIKSNLALEIAIKKHDLHVIKMLLERKEDDKPYDDVKGRQMGRERRRKKRRRMSDRVIITPKLVQLALSRGSEEIVNYFVEEKGESRPLHPSLLFYPLKFADRHCSRSLGHHGDDI